MTLESFLDHIGLGTDWDGFETIPDHFMSDISDLPVITGGLSARGYDADEIEKILGGNWLRVFEKNFRLPLIVFCV